MCVVYTTARRSLAASSVLHASLPATPQNILVCYDWCSNGFRGHKRPHVQPQGRGRGRGRAVHARRRMPWPACHLRQPAPSLISTSTHAHMGPLCTHARQHTTDTTLHKSPRNVSIAFNTAGCCLITVMSSRGQAACRGQRQPPPREAVQGSSKRPRKQTACQPPCKKRRAVVVVLQAPPAPPPILACSSRLHTYGHKGLAV